MDGTENTGGMGWVAKAILTALAIIIIIVVIRSFSDGAYHALDNAACDRSIAEHLAAIKLSGGGVVTTINCPTETINVSSSSQSDVKRSIAEAMRGCWTTWKRGNRSFFDGNGVFCHICSNIFYDDEEVSVEGFKEYLTTTNMVNSRQKYSSYLTNSHLPRSYDVLADVSETDITLENFTTSEPTAVIFLQARGQEYTKQVISTLSKGVSWGVTIGVVVVTTAAGAKLGGMIGTFGGGFIGGSAGLVLGSVLGVAAGLYTYASLEDAGSIEPPEEFSIVVSRPLREDVLTNLTCEYVPVKTA